MRMNMRVTNKYLGEGTVVAESPISVGGFDIKVKFDNGIIKWCSKNELTFLEEAV